MKYTLFSLMALSFGLNVQAQVSDTPSRIPDYCHDTAPMGYIYGEFAAGGETKFTVWDGTNWNVYDSDLKLEKRFPVTLPERHGGYTLTRRREGVKFADGSIRYIGNWVEEREVNGGGGGYSFGRLFPDGGEFPEYNAMCLTQHLFNDDDDYEYITFVWKPEAGESYETDRDGDGEIDEIRTIYRDVVDKVQIVQDNGRVLQTIDDMPYDPLYWLELVKMKDKYYLRYYEERTDGPSYVCFRRIDPNSSTAVQEVSARMKVAARPTIASPADRITVTLEGKADVLREVTVTGADGRVVWQTKVAAGETSLSVPANRLAPGLNVINVSGPQSNSCKVIVK